MQSASQMHFINSGRDDETPQLKTFYPETAPLSRERCVNCVPLQGVPLAERLLKILHAYLNVRKDGRGLVEIDPVAAATVRRIFHLFAYERRILEIVFLNCHLDDATLVPTIRKPFDVLAEGAVLENHRSDRI